MNEKKNIGFAKQWKGEYDEKKKMWISVVSFTVGSIFSVLIFALIIEFFSDDPRQKYIDPGEMERYGGEKSKGTSQ